MPGVRCKGQQGEGVSSASQVPSQEPGEARAQHAFKRPDQSPLAFPAGLARAPSTASFFLWPQHLFSNPQTMNESIFKTWQWTVQGRMILSRNSSGPWVCSSHSTFLVKSGRQHSGNPTRQSRRRQRRPSLLLRVNHLGVQPGSVSASLRASHFLSNFHAQGPWWLGEMSPLGSDIWTWRGLGDDVLLEEVHHRDGFWCVNPSAASSLLSLLGACV